MRLILAFSLLALTSSFGQLLYAPNIQATPADQLKHSKQACGPASLLNQLRFGNSQQQSAEQSIPVQGDTRKLRWIIGRYGIKPSSHISSQKRWQPGSGVNVADLLDMANDMAAELRSPKLAIKPLERKGDNRDQELLRRSHRLIKKSLDRGIPPILQLRLFVNRHYPKVNRRIWMGVHGHFVVIIGIEKSLKKDATRFTVQYADPWHGKKLTGKIKIPKNQNSTPYLEVDFPLNSLGKKHIKKGEQSQLTCPNLIGKF